MNEPPSETVRLLERLRAGDRRALADLFQRHRDRLRRMVELRIDARLQGRVDASDVLQDGFLDVAKRVEGYLERSPAARVPLAATGGQRSAGDGPPRPPRRADAGRRPGGFALSRSVAAGPARRPWPRCCWGA